MLQRSTTRTVRPMAALTGLLGDYGSEDESAASDHEAVGPKHAISLPRCLRNRQSCCCLCKTSVRVLSFLIIVLQPPLLTEI